MREVECADPSPFDLPGSGAAAALCLHGLSGTPYEVRPLGVALAARGIRAFGPALPGHNETPAALAATSHRDWLAAARNHLGRLRRSHERVFAVGVSMGGLVSLALAEEGAVDAVVTVGVPLALRQPLAILLPLLRILVPFPRKTSGSDIRDPEARRRHPSYDVMPLASVRELQQLQRLVRSRLGRVRVPVLVAHGAHDRTARLADAERIHAAVGSADRRLLICTDSGHVVPVDRDGPRLARAAADFLAEQLPGAGAAAGAAHSVRSGRSPRP
jgi:carboxylesterase